MEGIPIDKESVKRTHSNLNRQEMDALNNLKNKKHIVFKPSDKGSGIILMNENYYRQKILSMLEDTSTYKPLEKILIEKQ